MTKFSKFAMATALVLGLASSTVYADPVKGQKIFIKKFKKACGFNGAKFAAKHSQAQWEAIGVDGMKQELMKQCPSLEEGKIKVKWMQHVYDFSYEYANDSGNVPSC